MNFDFSDDSQALRAEAQRFLREQCPPSRVRAILERDGGMDAELWREICALGWPGAAVGEAHGGSGMNLEALCVLAEEMGRALAPVPFGESTYFVMETLRHAGAAELADRYLPGLVDGTLIGTAALFEAPGGTIADVSCRVESGKIWGTKICVPFGAQANVALVSARGDMQASRLFIVDLHAAGIRRNCLASVDPNRPLADLVFDGAGAESIADQRFGDPAFVADRAAVFFAFEQIGGAQACLEMACAYARERIAFGRAIGSFQAIKHKLARVYVAIELARANAYRALWAMSQTGESLALEAALARISAAGAFEQASAANILVHGGMGATWESDCHLYYRRAGFLAGALGGSSYWKRRAFQHMGAAQGQE